MVSDILKKDLRDMDLIAEKCDERVAARGRPAGPSGGLAYGWTEGAGG